MSLLNEFIEINEHGIYHTGSNSNSETTFFLPLGVVRRTTFDKNIEH